jgi:hypothetical protein
MCGPEKVGGRADKIRAIWRWTNRPVCWTIHRDAWAAGPVLHVVPNIVAMGAAAIASVALAALALRERNETLFAWESVGHCWLRL